MFDKMMARYNALSAEWGTTRLSDPRHAEINAAMEKLEQAMLNVLQENELVQWTQPYKKGAEC